MNRASDKVGKRFVRTTVLFTLLLALSTVAALSSSAQPVAAQTENQNNSYLKQSSQESADDSDSTMFYAFLKEDESEPGGPLYDLMKDNPVFKAVTEPRSPAERKFRPAQQWRRWANKAQKFLPSLLFIAAVCSIFRYFFPGLMQKAQSECKQSFWKCLGTGLLLSVVSLTLVRVFLLSGIGWSLAVVLAGISEATALMGLSVSIANLGHALFLLFRINKMQWTAKHPEFHAFLEIISGSAVAALILQIPSAGSFPRCGTRLLALLAILGVGGLWKILKTNKR